MSVRHCECGCGAVLPERSKSHRAEGPLRFLHGHNVWVLRRCPDCNSVYRRGDAPGHCRVCRNTPTVAVTSTHKWTGYTRAQKLPKPETCEECGATEWLDRHHKDGNQLNNDPSNIAHLCRRCHRWAHSRPDIATHCKYGHEWTEENTRFVKNSNSRRCRACHREEQRKYLARKQMEVPSSL